MAFKFKADADAFLAANALRAAAELYQMDADRVPELQRQFTDQATAAKRIAEEIEAAYC